MCPFISLLYSFILYNINFKNKIMKKLLALLCACVMVSTNAWAQFMPELDPASPQNVTAEYVGGGYVKVSWDPITTTIDGSYLDHFNMQAVVVRRSHTSADVEVFHNWHDDVIMPNGRCEIFDFSAPAEGTEEFWYEVYGEMDGFPGPATDSNSLNGGSGSGSGSGSGGDQPSCNNGSCKIPTAPTDVLAYEDPEQGMRVDFKYNKKCIHDGNIGEMGLITMRVKVFEMPSHVERYDGYLTAYRGSSSIDFYTIIHEYSTSPSELFWYEVQLYDNTVNELSAPGYSNVFNPTLYKTLGANGYSTYTSEFDCTISGAEAYSCTYDGGDVVTLNAIDPSYIVKAGEGIILKGTEGVQATITVCATGGEAIDGNAMVGVAEGTGVAEQTTSFATGTNYVLAKNNATGNVEFVRMAVGKTVAQMYGKAYLNIPGGAAQSLSIDFGSFGLTGIKTLDAEKSEAAEIAYDLFGREMKGAQSGLRVSNGRVVMVK